MPLFEFECIPLHKVIPWGEEPNLSLSWYGLTDGIYYMNVGSAQLFRYTSDVLQRWNDESEASEDMCCYFEYQVARLYEDILYCLADVLEPIPDNVFSRISTIENQLQWSQRMSDVYHLIESEDVDNLYYECTEWLDCRSPDGMGGGPCFWFLRNGDTMYIRWDNRGTTIGAIDVWTATTGELKISVADFKSEVYSFHNRLMQAMGARVDAILNNNPFALGVIDLDGLATEHKERVKSLENAYSRNPTPVNWQSAMAASKELLSKDA